jgi:hypothetical protein
MLIKGLAVWRPLSQSIAVWLLALLMMGASPEMPDIQLQVTGTVETVFQWQADRCDDLQIPDSPARAVRLQDGRIVLISAHFNNIALVGPNFDAMYSHCASASLGSEAADPKLFDDRFWIQAIVPLPNGKLLGIASHEYRGTRHNGYCESLIKDACWYSSLLAASADPHTLRFKLAPQPYRIIAAARLPGGMPPAQPTGFFTTSNVVVDGSFGYILATQRNMNGREFNVCLFRAPIDDLSSGWRAMQAGKFQADFRSPLAADLPEPVCDPIGKGILGSVRSLVRLGTTGPWIAIFVGREQGQEGVLYSRSNDLIKWSEPKLLWSMTSFRGQSEPGIYYQYPSIIDHKSSSAIFDSISDQAWLYLTRFNLLDRKRGQDRDLVRLRVSVTENNNSSSKEP